MTDIEKAREMPSEKSMEKASGVIDAWISGPSLYPQQNELQEAIATAFDEMQADYDRVAGYYNALCEELQAIGEEYGFLGGEPRTDAIRRVYRELLARAEAAESALDTAIAETREEMAKLAENAEEDRGKADSPYDGGSGSLGYAEACRDIASAIRATGKESER